MQTELVNELTMRINQSFDLDIRIGNARIDFKGNIGIRDLIIRDHKSDTLLFTPEFSFDVQGLNRLFQGDFNLTEVKVQSPFLKIIHYENETESNVSQFLKKINSTKKQEFNSGNLASFQLNEGKLIYHHLAENNLFSYDNLSLNLSEISFDKDHYEVHIDTFSFTSLAHESLRRLNAHLVFTPEVFRLSNLTILTQNTDLEGELVINNPKTTLAALLTHSEISFAVNKGKLSTNLFADQFPLRRDIELGFSASFKGDFNTLLGEIQLRHSKQSKLNLKTQLTTKKRKLAQLGFSDIDGTLLKEELAKLLLPSFFKQNRLSKLNWEKINVQGSGNYLSNKSAQADLNFLIGKSKLELKSLLDLSSVQWFLNQTYVFSDLDVGKLINKNNLMPISGSGKLAGEINDNAFENLRFDTDINSFGWKGIGVNTARLDGSLQGKELQLGLEVSEEKFKAKMEVKIANIEERNFVVSTEIEEINLSSFGWTPKDSEVKLKSDIVIVNDASGTAKIDFSNFKLTNTEGSNLFKDFSISYQEENGLVKISQQGSDFLDFDIEGEFRFQDIPSLFQNGVEEALLIPPTRTVTDNQYFKFNFLFRESLLKSLYPTVSNPEDISFEGYISAKKNRSTFRFNLPYIEYRGLRFESISFSTNANGGDYLSQFDAKKIEGEQFQLSSISLTTKEIEEQLLGTIHGDLGSKSEDTFDFSFFYTKEEAGSSFQLNEVDIFLGGVHWNIPSANRPFVFVENEFKQIKIEDLSLKTDQQKIALALDFSSRTDFNLRLLTENVDLYKALPKGGKFIYGGSLSTDINVIRSSESQKASAELAIADLEINEVNMGDFTLNIVGNPQFNTYNLSALLMKNNINRLEGQGTIFVPKLEPNLNIDIVLNQFDLSFLAPLGKDKITHSKGEMFADLNLWGVTSDLKLNGSGYIKDGSLQIPSTNTQYAFKENATVLFRDRKIDFVKTQVVEVNSTTEAELSGSMSHFNFAGWEMDMEMQSDHFLVYNRPKDPSALFYGQGYLSGKASFLGPTKSLTLTVEGSSSEGTTLVIPWQEDKGLSDTSFIDFLSKGDKKEEIVTANISSLDEEFRGFEMVFDLDINRNAEVEIVVDQSSGSTLSGRGSGNILVESNIDGKFNIWGDFIAYEGEYNFKNLSLVDKKFSVKEGGTIVWEGDPLEAQLNIEATYQVPGGANPALLVDNPNFNRKIPTNVTIQLVGNLLRPDDPVFDISFPNTTGILISEINYRLADQQRRQLQAISLLSQGIFISDVSVSFQGITNNLYEKASDMFSSILGTNEGKLNVGLNYLQGEENSAIDLKTEDRIGLTLSTQISDRILINGKIGVPIDGLEETVIVGDVQIDFILNESGSLRAKVFNRENDFRYLGDEFGYTQGMGMSYQVDFDTFQDLILQITQREENIDQTTENQSDNSSIDYLNKKN